MKKLSWFSKGSHNLVIPRPEAEESAVAFKSRSLAEFIPSEVEGLGMTFPVGSRRVAAGSLIAMMALFLFSSCRGNGTLTSSVNTPTGSIAGTPGATATRLNGSASGGLSPIKAGTVTLYQAGNASALATAATDSNGAFQLSLPSLKSNGLYYIVVTSGNAGSGSNNANIQEMAMLGTGATIPSTASVNELTTAASLMVGNNLGFLNEGSGGQVTLSTPVSTIAVTNSRLQYLNFINLTNGTLNTGNSNLTSTHQSVLATMANAFAACVQNSSQCATLFSNAANLAGSAANVLDAGYKMLNGLTSITEINNQASSMSSSTGYTIPSAPSTLNVNFAATKNSFGSAYGFNGPICIAIDGSGNAWVTNDNTTTVSKLNAAGASLGTFAVGTNPAGIAIDGSGNVWAANFSSNNVTELTSAGASLGNFSVGTGPNGIAIDASGNVWTANQSSDNVTKLSSAGSLLGTFSVGGGNPYGIAIDASGNAWEANDSSSTVTKLTSSGASLGNFSVGITPRGIAIDASGNAWVSNRDSSSVTKLTSSGASLGNFSVGTHPQGIAIDASGNVWTANNGSNNVTELTSSGASLGNFSVGQPPSSIAIDASSGNVWVTSYSGNTVTEFAGITTGQFFPYSGPVFPGANF